MLTAIRVGSESGSGTTPTARNGVYCMQAKGSDYTVSIPERYYWMHLRLSRTRQSRMLINEPRVYTQ